MTTEKRCTDCKTTKPISEFNKNKSEKDGYTHVCKACRKVRSKKRYEEKRDEILEANEARRKENPEPSRRAARESKRRSRERGRQEKTACRRCGVSMEKIKYSHNKFCLDCRLQNRKDHYEKYYNDNRLSILQWNREYAASEIGQANRKKNYENYIIRNASEIQKKRREQRDLRKNDENYIAARLACSLTNRSERGTTPKEHITHLFKWQEGCCYYCSRMIPKGFRTRHMDHIIPIALGGSANPRNIALACNECNSMAQKGAQLLEREWQPVCLNDGHTIYSPIRKEIANVLSENGIDVVWNGEAILANGVIIHALSTFWASERYLPNAAEVIEELDGIIIYDYEWLYKKESWLNVILARCGVYDKETCSKYIVSDINFEDAKQFLNRYHVDGFVNGTVHIGLFRDEELIGVATFSLKDMNWELNRMAFSYNRKENVKCLLNYFIENKLDYGKLIVYADPRYEYSYTYLSNGFIEKGETPQPMYFYATPEGLYHRLSGSQGRMERDADYFEKALPEVLLNKINGRYRVYGKRQLRFMLAPASY